MIKTKLFECDYSNRGSKNIDEQINRFINDHNISEEQVIDIKFNTIAIGFVRDDGKRDDPVFVSALLIYKE